MTLFRQFIAYLHHIVSVFVSWLVNSIACFLEPAQPPAELPMATLKPCSTVSIMRPPHVRIPEDVLQQLQAGPPPRKLSSSLSGAGHERKPLKKMSYMQRSKSYISGQQATYSLSGLRRPRASFMIGTVPSITHPISSPSSSHSCTPIVSYPRTSATLGSPCPSPTAALTQIDHDFKCSCNEGRLSVPGLETYTSPLSKRRGFKGAPLSTSSLTLKSSLLVLPPTLSLLGPRSPVDWPSTPRSPLEAVTNLIRTKKCFIKDISQDLQEFYDDSDPFSTFSYSFFTPSQTFHTVPTANMNNLDPYFHAHLSSSRTQSLKHKSSVNDLVGSVTSLSKRKFAMKTTIYDMSIADVPAKLLPVKKRKSKPKSRRPTTMPPRSSPALVLTLSGLAASPDQIIQCPTITNEVVLPEASIFDKMDGQDNSNERESMDLSSEKDVILLDSAFSPELPLLPHVSLHDLYDFGTDPHNAKNPWTPQTGHLSTPTETLAANPSYDSKDMKACVIDSAKVSSSDLRALPKSGSSPSSGVWVADLHRFALSSFPKDEADEAKAVAAQKVVTRSVSLDETKGLLRRQVQVVDQPGTPPRRHVRHKSVAIRRAPPSFIGLTRAANISAPLLTPPVFNKHIPEAPPPSPKCKANFHIASRSWALPDKPRAPEGYGRHRRSVAVDHKTGRIITMSSMSVAGMRKRTIATVERKKIVEKDPFGCFPTRPIAAVKEHPSVGIVLFSRPAGHLVSAGSPATNQDQITERRQDALVVEVEDQECQDGMSKCLSPRRKSQALGDIISLLDCTESRGGPRLYGSVGKSDSLATVQANYGLGAACAI